MNVVATSLSRTNSNASSCNNHYQNSDGEEYQVDCGSVSSSKDGQDQDDCETEGSLVLARNSHVPSFGSVSVVNSNDVHFGNKTVYQGPVTIKQFMYPNGAPSECVNPDLNLPATVDGVDNAGFAKDSGCDANKDSTEKVASAAEYNVQQTLPGIRKGCKWLRNVPKQHKRGIAIFMLVIIISITILTAVIFWRHPSRLTSDFLDNDVDEQEYNAPADPALDYNIAINKKLRLVSRLQWLAQPPIEQPDPLKTPVALVIVQHTATEPCYSLAQCIFHVKTIQKYHIESNHWWDIGYNFLVGGDGAAYEGRGWTQEGSHTFGYNNKSIGVGFIGTFTAQKPPLAQIVAFNKLIEKGVELNYIQKDYKILAARQLYGTESPGTAFFNEVIKTWSHWAEEP